VYLLTNRHHTVVYTGVTGNVHRRMKQHKQKHNPGFTARYNADRLVYFECYERINDALAREKQIKAGSRQKKLDLINAFNPDWRDLSEEVWRL
jgi:putative endonuclease